MNLLKISGKNAPNYRQLRSNMENLGAKCPYAPVNFEPCSALTLDSLIEPACCLIQVWIVACWGRLVQLEFCWRSHQAVATSASFASSKFKCVHWILIEHCQQSMGDYPQVIVSRFYLDYLALLIYSSLLSLLKMSSFGGSHSTLGMYLVSSRPLACMALDQGQTFHRNFRLLNSS